jgi:ribosomal-protein-alanine N-acetyltransferase
MENKEDFFRLNDTNISLFSFGERELHSDEYLKWMNDIEVTRTLGRHDYLRPVSRRQLIEYLDTVEKEGSIFLAIYLDRDGALGKVEKEDKKFIGTLKIYGMDFLAKRAEIGIAIGDKSEWGRGHAATAIRIACGYIFNTLGFRKIVAGYIANNVGMERAFLKNGFQIEATFKEHLHFEGHYVDHIFVSKFNR